MGRQRTTIVINGERTVIEGPTRTPADLAASQQQRYRDGFAPGVPDSELRQTAAEIYDAKLQRLATLEIENQMPEGGGTFFQRKAEEEMQAAAAPPAPARPEPVEMKVPREPTRITEFLRKSGGVQDQGGEISHVIGGKRFRPGLINGRGMTLDDAALRAWEEGYFPEMTERPTINDLLQAVQDEAQGIRRYSAKDEAAVTAYQGALAHNAEVDRLSNETGIETAGKTRSQFFDAVRDHLSVEEAARRAETLATAHEISLAAAERRAAEWAASRGDAWEADYDVGRPRTLEELEDAYRQEEAARWPRAGAGGAGAPGSATGAPRPVQAGAGPGERGIGTGRLAEPATELTDQGEQLIFPGAERSARQAAQARETTGRGMMRGATPQEEAGGLFALPKEAQEELFAAQQRLSEIESGLSAEEREQIAVAQAALPEAEAKAQAIAEAALCLKDTGL
jgi:hypothetical protein